MNNRPPSLPFSIIRELKCRNCQNVVSCGPVYVIPDDSILCGRCHNFAKDIYRNIPFEALASMFIYPCQYWEDHCPKILHWNECLDHEDGCSFNNNCGLFWKHPKAFLKGKRDMPYGDIRLIPIPETLLDYIKCTYCENYLSCEPVYIRSDDKNICHRCILSNGVPQDCVRNTAYEILSNIIIFPCIFRNRGCPTRLKFGSDMWHHETECSYNQMFKNLQQQQNKKAFNQKERGVIKTHSGHVYGTITPNAAPFSPPTFSNDFDINKQLVKSLIKKQERKLLRAEEIEDKLTKMNFEDGALDRDFNKGEFDKQTVSEISTPSSGRYDEPDYNQLTPQTPDSKPLTPVFVNSPKDFLHFNYTNVKAFNENTNNYYQNIYVAQVHKENDSSSQNLHTPPLNKYQDEENYENVSRFSMNNFYTKNGYNDGELGSPTVLKTPLQELNYNPLDGPPIYINPYGQGLIPKPSFRGVVRTDSLSSNRKLINELKIRQSKLRQSAENKEADNPYQECNNLEDILQVHDKIAK